MSEKRFLCHPASVGVHIGVGTDEHELTGDECRDLLNKLSAKCQQLEKENERFKSLLKEAINNERTDMGRNSLKQLAERLGVEY